MTGDGEPSAAERSNVGAETGPAPAVETVTGTGIPVRGNDVDTDQIVPARFMKVVTFEGLGQYAFHDQRFDESGEPTDHPFNQSRFADASVLAVNANFGTGSSREHAPQALARWGIDAIVGESFAEIFAGNCLALGIPTARAEPGVVGALQDWIEANPGSPIAVDVAGETVSFGEQTEPVSFGETARRTLLEGVWDTTAVMRDNLEAVRDVARSLPYVDDGPGGTATDD